MGCGSSRVGDVVTFEPRLQTTTSLSDYNINKQTVDNKSLVSSYSNEIENLEKYNSINQLTEGTSEPFKLKKKKLVSSLIVFVDTDKHVLQTPPSLQSSIHNLAEYLTQPFADSELLKLRVLWRWVTQNIKWDIDKSFKREECNNNIAAAADALKSRKANCFGYSGLLKVLAETVRLKVEIVTGWAKDSSYQTGANLREKDANYVWNAVYLSHSWWLLDPTWGSGYIDENKEFVQEYNEHYFLTDPKQFIFDHYPEDLSWQLIDPTITIEQFEALPKFSKHFFQLALRPVTHLNGIINTKTGKVHMKFKLDKDTKIDCIGSLVKKNDNTESDQYLHIYMTDKILHVLINLPYPGEYELKLFAGISSRKSSQQLPGISSYIVRCRKKLKLTTIYPKHHKKWSCGFYLYSPLEGELVVGKTYHFRIGLANVYEMAVCLGGKVSCWEQLSVEGNIWHGEISMITGTERVNVVAKLKEPKNTTFTSLLEYKVVPKNKTAH